MPALIRGQYRPDSRELIVTMEVLAVRKVVLRCQALEAELGSHRQQRADQQQQISALIKVCCPALLATSCASHACIEAS